MNEHKARVFYPELSLLSQAVQWQERCHHFPFSCSGPGLFTWPDKINKGGQFRPTDSNEKSLTADS